MCGFMLTPLAGFGIYPLTWPEPRLKVLRGNTSRGTRRHSPGANTAKARPLAENVVGLAGLNQRPSQGALTPGRLAPVVKGRRVQDDSGPLRKGAVCPDAEADSTAVAAIIPPSRVRGTACIIRLASLPLSLCRGTKGSARASNSGASWDGQQVPKAPSDYWGTPLTKS